MTSPAAEASLLRFGVFELDRREQELRRGGILIKLSPQQFRVLRMLAERRGQLCTREEIQREVWGSEVFVDFDRGLNVCIAAIRAALNDNSEAPRFIQTVPRQGYRFVAPVETVLPGGKFEAPPPVRKSKTPALAAIAAGLAAMAAAAVILLPQHSKRLAVLPFENLTGDIGEAPLAAGFTDELTTQLGSADPGRLAVIGRTSASRYAAGKAALNDLAADYVIEGSLRAEGDRMRVAVRLLETRRQTQIWNHTFQSTGAGRLEWQETLALSVTRAVTAKLFSREARLPPPYQADPKAAEAYWNGRYLDRRDRVRSIHWFERAAELDRGFAAPRVALAETWLSDAMTGRDPAGSFAKARVLAQDAMKLEEWNAEAHAIVGAVAFWNDWNRREARRQFERALELNPSLARAHHDYGFLLVETGAPDAGLSELRTGIALDPVSPRVNIDAGWVFLQARRFDDAIKYAKRARELEPQLEEARMCIARAEIYQGRGKPEDLVQLRASTNPYYRAMAAAIGGDKRAALAALDEAMATHNIMLTMVGTEPAFDSVRHEPHFRDLQHRVGMKD